MTLHSCESESLGEAADQESVEGVALGAVMFGPAGPWIIQTVVDTAGFFALEGAFDGKIRHDGDIAKFQNVRMNFEIGIIVFHFGQNVFHSVRSAHQAFVGADDSDVIPHQAADFVPHMIDDDHFIIIGFLWVNPLAGNLRRHLIAGPVLLEFLRAVMSHRQAFKQ